MEPNVYVRNPKAESLLSTVTLSTIADLGNLIQDALRKDLNWDFG